MNALVVQTQDKSAPQIPALTGVRALAAYLVFLHHALRGDEVPVLAGMASEGHIGVTIFFVLSGFLITYRYEERFRLGEQRLRDYLWNRFARIYPLYAVVAVATLLWIGERDIGHWALNLSLAKGLFDETKFDGVSQAWSLTVEETFYLTAPLAFLARRSGHGRWVLPVTYGAGVLLCLAGAPTTFIVSYTFAGRAFEFFVGWVVARRLSSGAGLKQRHCTWLGLGCVLGVLFALDQLKSSGYAWGVLHPTGMFINNVVLPPAVGLLLWGLATEDTRLARILGSAVGQQLGKSSYAFYLIHLGPFSDQVTEHIGSWARFFAVSVVAWALFRWIEEPVNRWLRHQRRRPHVLSTTSQAEPAL